MIPMKRFVERCAVVTGGASGIGLAICERLLAEGARVAVWDKDSARLQELTQRFGTAVVTTAADVTDASDVERAAQQAIGALGRIDILVRQCGHYRAQRDYLGISD